MTLTKLPTPLGRLVLVKIAEIKEKMADGIVLHETRFEPPMDAEVMVLGVGDPKPYDFEVGDTVIIPFAGHTTVSIFDKPYLIVQEEDVLGVREL